MLALFLVNGACQRSQFATTTRHSINGKITYVNHYPSERTKSSKVKYPKNHLTETKTQNNSPAPDRTGVQNLPEPEITKDNNILITNSVDFLASTSNKTIIYKPNKNLINSDNHKINPINDYFRGTINDSIADIIKRKTSNKNLTFDPSFAHIIKFKNGKEETVRIISHSHETLYYQLISEPNVKRGVMMEQIDTILTDTTYLLKQEKENTIKETESHDKHTGLVVDALMGLLFRLLFHR